MRRQPHHHRLRRRRHALAERAFLSADRGALRRTARRACRRAGCFGAAARRAKRNLKLYGFGIKGFTLSMIETAVEVTGGRVPGEVVARILAIGRELLAHPIEMLPHAREALEALAGPHRLVLITKGDLFDQERKVAQSGVGELFDAVEIVSDKDVATYARIFSRYGDGPERSMMVGNSLKSDVVPAIEAGSWGVYVPHELTWVLEHVDAPNGSSALPAGRRSRPIGGDDCRDRRALKRRTAGSDRSSTEGLKQVEKDHLAAAKTLRTIDANQPGSRCPATKRLLRP